EFQISDDDCSTISPASCHILIGCFAVASSFPVSSKMPARVLEVPTSTPIKARCIFAPVNFDASLPASVATIDKNNASRHQAGRPRGKEENHCRNLVHLPQPRHWRAADPGVVHAWIALHEGVQGRLDVGRRNGVDAYSPRAPFGRERFGQVMY